MKSMTEASDVPRPPESSHCSPASAGGGAAVSSGVSAVDSGTSAAAAAPIQGAAAPPQGTYRSCGGAAGQHVDHCIYSIKTESSKPSAGRGGAGNGSAPMPPHRQPSKSGGVADAGPSVAARLTRACQSTLIGRTLQSYGGIVQVVTEPAPPYRLVGVSGGWERLTGWRRDEVVGRPLDFLQGVATEKSSVMALMQKVRTQQAVSLRLTNYTKAGVSYVHQLTCEPLRAPSGATHCFQATSIVLRHPGEAEETEILAAGQMPLLGSVSPQHVPPLWRLLGGRPPPGFPALAPGACTPQTHRPPFLPMDTLLTTGRATGGTKRQLVTQPKPPTKSRPPHPTALPMDMAAMFGAADDLGVAGMGVADDVGVGMGGSVPLQPLAMGNGVAQGPIVPGPSSPMLNDVDLMSWCTSAPSRLPCSLHHTRLPEATVRLRPASLRPSPLHHGRLSSPPSQAGQRHGTEQQHRPMSSEAEAAHSIAARAGARTVDIGPSCSAHEKGFRGRELRVGVGRPCSLLGHSVCMQTGLCAQSSTRGGEAGTLSNAHGRHAGSVDCERLTKPNEMWGVIRCNISGAQVLDPWPTALIALAL